MKKQISWPFPWPQELIAQYTAYRVDAPPIIDGLLNENCWKNAPRSPRFSDLISGGRTLYDTHAAVLWDDEFLYVGYWIEEPDVRARLTERDALIYEENDVEFFVAGQDAYYEFEINALGTIYEVFFVWEEAFSLGAITCGLSSNVAFRVCSPLMALVSPITRVVHGLDIGIMTSMGCAGSAYQWHTQ